MNGVTGRRRPHVWALVTLAVALTAAGGAVAGLTSSESQVRSGTSMVALTPALAGAPWLQQDGGAVTISSAAQRQSLAFSAGVTFTQALTAIYVSALETGDIPSTATLVDPLPAGVVLSGDPDTGIIVSLVAPWGWDVGTGRIRPPSYSLPATLTPEAVETRIDLAESSGSALPAGASIDVPALPPCQVLLAPDASPTSCAATTGVTP